MIYVDVTGGCLLPLQSGIPRTTRGVWRLLQREGAETMPICWQPFRGTYTRLSSRALNLLEDGPKIGREPAPRDATLSLLKASLGDLCFWPKRVNLSTALGAESTLLLTSIFPDNRLGCLRRLKACAGKRVAIFHDAIPLRDRNVAGWERKRHLSLLRVFAEMNLVVAVSGASAGELRTLWGEHGIKPAKVVALPWPVPFEGFRPPFARPNPAVKRVLYVSRLKAVKNHVTLFAACERLWREGFRFELELIGCEDEATESRKIRRRMAELQSAGRAISWRAQVSDDELHAAYAQASFTVFPSRMEGFGLPVVESLWHGRGVICSGDGAVGEIAREGGCVVVNVESEEELATAMRELLQNEARCGALAEEAYARRVRTWTDYGKELLPLLSSP